MSPEGQRAARLVIHQGLHLLWNLKLMKNGHNGGQNAFVDASTTFSRARLKHVLLDLCEHNRYESMVVQVLNVIQERINHPAMVTWLTAA